MSVSAHPNRRRAVALLMTLLLVVLLIAAVSRTTTTAAVATIRGAQRTADLQHRLAVDSTLLVAAQQLARDSTARHDVERGGSAVVSLTLMDCAVTCVITSDAGKLAVAAFERKEDRRLLERKLADLQQRLVLPPAEVQLRPVLPRNTRRRNRQDRAIRRRYLWFDQLFDDAAPGAYFLPGSFRRDDESVRAPNCWSEVVTFWGDGRVDVRSAHPEVLRVLLADVDPTAAAPILRARDNPRKSDPLAAALQGRDEVTRQELQRRLGSEIARYALHVETTTGADRRHWYVVAGIVEGSVGTIHYRGQVRW